MKNVISGILAKPIGAILSLTMCVLLASQPMAIAKAQGSPDLNPVLNIKVDLSEHMDPELANSLVVTLRDEPVQSVPQTNNRRYRFELDPGHWTIKALVPGWGADRANIRVTEDTKGEFTLTLRPHITGLAEYPDSYRLQWVGAANQSMFANTLPHALEFLDSNRNRIKITEITDARLACRGWTGETLKIKDNFDLEPNGKIRLIAPEKLQQKIISCDIGGRNHKLTIAAYNAQSGLAYETSTEQFRFGHLTVAGQVVLGETAREDLSLENIEVVVGGAKTSTNSNGEFVAVGAPLGEVSVSARKSVNDIHYSARGKINAVGPSKIRVTIEKWDRSRTRERVEVISEEAFIRDQPTLVGRLNLNIPENARFRMINLAPIADVAYHKSELELVAEDCRNARDHGWRMLFCPALALGPRITRKKVWSGPEPNATRLGDLIIDQSVSYLAAGSDRPVLVSPEYYQGDWDYMSYGYAVTVLAMENDRVAIHLPQTDEIGWLNLADFEDERHADLMGSKERYLGFSPPGEHCGFALGFEQIVLEQLDPNQFAYRIPTPHDLWSVFDETEQPTQTESDSITAHWRNAYSDDRRLLLIPIAAKTC